MKYMLNNKNNKLLLAASLISFIGFMGVLLLLMSYFNRPISDDYHFASLGSNPISTAIEGYMQGNGRFGQYFFFSLYETIFGLRHAVMIAPLINTVFLGLAFSFLYFQLVAQSNVATPRKAMEVLGVGAAASIVAIFSAKSFFDSNLWLDSNVSYIPSLFLGVFSVGLYVWVLKSKKAAWSHFVLFLAVVFIAQQFSEPTAAILIVLYSVMTVFFAFRKDRAQTLISLAAAAVAVIGLLCIYFSPGSTDRRVDYNSVLDIKNMLFNSLSYFQYAISNALSWRFGLYMAFGALLAALFKDRFQINQIGVKYILLAAVALVLLPYYVLFVVSEYSLPGYIALRTYQVPAALAGIGLALIIAVIIIRIKVLSRSVVILLFALSVVIAVVLSVKPLSTIIKAQAIRSIQYDYREISIQQQIISGADTIYVLPAPILLNDAEPGEFLYREGKQIDWFETSFKEYYKLSNKRVIVMNQQLAPYCMVGEHLPWWNIRSCEALNNSMGLHSYY